MVRGSLWEIDILRKGRCVIVGGGGGDVWSLGWSLIAAVVAAGEDVMICSGDGSNGLFRVAIVWVGGSISLWIGLHFQCS